MHRASPTSVTSSHSDAPATLRSGVKAAPATAARLMQQPLHHPLPGRVARQQQQSNGIPEFQPRLQQGSHAAEDGVYTLSAYLERAARAGEMPGPRVVDIGSARTQRSSLSIQGGGPSGQTQQ